MTEETVLPVIDGFYPRPAGIYQEIHDERRRAVVLHGISAMDSPYLHPGKRLAILVEEVGEVAKELCVGEGEPIDVPHLREELIQVAAMASAWADQL